MFNMHNSSSPSSVSAPWAFFSISKITAEKVTDRLGELPVTQTTVKDDHESQLIHYSAIQCGGSAGHAKKRQTVLHLPPGIA